MRIHEIIESIDAAETAAKAMKANADRQQRAASRLRTQADIQSLQAKLKDKQRILAQPTNNNDKS